MVRHRALDEQRLKVLLGEDDAAPTTLLDGAAGVPDDAAPDDETYGLRVVWQSEAELIEAAEFLVATRVRRDESLRFLHGVGDLPDGEHPDGDAARG